jgi:hypothetical protein
VHQSKFVKKLDEIPKVDILPSTSRKKALDLADKGLIGQFTGIWPSPKWLFGWKQTGNLLSEVH